MMILNDGEKFHIERLYKIAKAELDVAQEAYAESAARVTRLTELTNTLCNMLDT